MNPPETSFNRRRAILILVAVMVLVATTIIVVLTNRTNEGDRGIDISRVGALAKQMPAEYRSTTSPMTKISPEVASRLSENSGANVRPSECATLSSERAHRLVGANAVTMNSTNDRLAYVVTAQELKQDGPGRLKDSNTSAACQRTTAQFADGTIVLAGPTTAPQIDGILSQGQQSVARYKDGTVMDSYVFTTWITDWVAVTVRVTSNPKAVPAANPIDPKEAQSLFVRAVGLVRGTS